MAKYMSYDSEQECETRGMYASKESRALKLLRKFHRHPNGKQSAVFRRF